MPLSQQLVDTLDAIGLEPAELTPELLGKVQTAIDSRGPLTPPLNIRDIVDSIPRGT